jgi:lysophospholipase L1-like esterase
MKYFYLYIFGLVLFIVAMAYWNSQGLTYFVEGFNPKTQYYLLLGDSILNNEVYVANGKSVNQLLNDSTNNRTTCLAKNDAIIADVYDQIGKIPDNLKADSYNTTIFLSIGGNDILNQSSDKEGGQVDSKVVNTIFSAYKQLIKSIQTIMPKSQLVLLDIYYPDNSKYRPLHDAISEWNNQLYNYAKENNLSVLRISNILTKPEDFTFEIEPSAAGSKKLVDAILANY